MADDFIVRYAITELLYMLEIEKVLTARAIVVAEDISPEEAARIMADSGIDGLPVCEVSGHYHQS